MLSLSLITHVYFLMAVWLGVCTCATVNANPTTISLVPSPTPSTIVDILSSDVQFSTFLRIAQREGLIPVLNSLQNVTLLAPVNSAFVDGPDHIDHNYLLRYIINQRFRVGYMEPKSAVFDTLYEMDNKTYTVSLSPNMETLEFEVDRVAAIVESDIYAKHQWSFIQALDHQLPLKPSLCDVFLDNSTNILNGHNISFVKGLFQSLFKLEFSTVDALVKTDDRYKKIPQSCEIFLKNAGTFFVPTDEMVRRSMSTTLMRYYSSLYHVMHSSQFTTTDEAVLEIKYDLTNLLGSLAIDSKLMPANVSASKCQSINKAVKFNVTVDDDSVILNHKLRSNLNTSIVFADAVMHLFDYAEGEGLFFETLQVKVADMIPRKALFALHYSDFVKELKFRSLQYLINGSTTNQTLFLSPGQRDDVMEEDSFFIDSFSNKDGLKYQFVKQSINITEKVFNNNEQSYYGSAETNLCSKSRIGGCFRMKVSSSVDASNHEIITSINDDANVIEGPIEMGNNSFAYMVNGDIDTPQSFKHTLTDLLSNGNLPGHLQHIQINQAECLKTIQFLKAHDLLSFKDNKLGYTAFLPCGIPILDDSTAFDRRGSWESLGLRLNYLEKNPKIFKKILRGIFVEGTIYSDFGLDNLTQQINTTTLQGDSLIINNQFYDGDYNHLLRINGTLFHLPLNSDLLFNQGVIHIVSKLLLPSTFEVPFVGLIKATEDDTSWISFMDLIEKFPKLYDALVTDNPKDSNYSMLVPSSESMKLYNVSASLTNLFEFLDAHLIPNSELPKIFNCIYGNHDNQTFTEDSDIHSNSSLLSFSCKQDSHGKLVFDVNDKSGAKTGHKLKILSHGCTSNDRTEGYSSCVFLIDKPINLKWFENDGFLHLHLGFISVGVGIILGLMFFSILLFMVMFCLSGKSDDTPKNPFEPYQEGGYMRISDLDEDPSHNYDGGYETDDDMLNERDHLIPQNSQKLFQRAGSLNASDYGATKPRTIPRYTNGTQSTQALNRKRNLPEV
ncbi:hypothetical protein PSN45_000254 [Yamadazyma tenuis]|uniref:FAS1 domain-containing protein n=1 Tax=Candida tenuis (strain ATCC 10573 / BCRC 21748 / CBS 615 / JCM 9827 / NBRC 10315 / NRRL Y-1498 / VKM Y-70) TaxID=590646 RepID=G3BBM8_CANTC|nr:uncharacterized protein CANTEDRAFT_124433 [Yamadazyma tenuis ATCC 10573]EGV61576.1 hypothetical protein CANTEDRAFT_124433 [Yamadazyma tenuis ATCC 10573]WEJ92798.1 hypothetical protein PSN45_000254 [Yamadazyma tenuis]